MSHSQEHSYFFLEQGIASKWKLVWYPDYQAYRIEAISDGEKDTNYAIDVRENQVVQIQ